MDRKIQYRLGLDIGTNSIGWAIVELDPETKRPIEIRDAGARIFSDGREVKSKTTLKSDRTASRSARRGRDRYKQRRRYLLDELEKAGLFPTDDATKLTLQKLDPLELRAKGLSEKLSLHEFGRTLFHLNQRRGFKSNRKDPESRSGVVRDSIDQLRQQLSAANARTLGEFLWQRRKKHETTRTRRLGTKQSDLYEFYPSRELLEDEFAQLWEIQRQHHPEILTLENQALFYKIIFTQRPLKPAKIGKCSYLSEEKRTYKALPSFQRYRILQEVNNLEWSTNQGTYRLIEFSEARDLILELFQKPKTKNARVTFSKIQKIIKEMEITESSFEFNLQSENRKYLDGDQTSAIMQQPDYVGDQWHQWTIKQQDDFISIILEPKELPDGREVEKEDSEIVEQLQKEFSLSAQQAEKCKDANLVDGVANISQKAANILNQYMDRDYLIQPDAVQRAVKEYQNEGFHNPYKQASQYELLKSLPYYGEAIRGHIVPGKGDEKDKQSRVGMVSNPTVHIAMNQIRHIINELIDRFGHPQSISIEMARDLPLGEIGRAKLNKQNKQNAERNKKIREELEEHRQRTSHDNLLRMKLWKELGENPMDRRCVFTGEIISIEDLFNDKTEIEHLIPFCISLDDGFMNQTLSHRRANRDKGNQTPFEAFGKSSNGYNWNEIYQRSQQLTKAKRWRFQEDAREIWKKDHDDFLARHLNDTRYIGRLTREYLSNICKPNKIDVVTGKLTSLLRHHWGLNNILGGNQKNRNDHRHHAVDAIIIALTNRSMIQKLATEAEHLGEHLNQSYESGTGRLFQNSENIQPWKDFRQGVESLVKTITVSHKASRHKSGQLHNDTAYGIINGPDEKGNYQLVSRHPIGWFETAERRKQIRDLRLKRKLSAVKAKEIPQKLRDMGIRSVRYIETLKSPVIIRDTQGNPYKAYKGDSNWAMEIYQLPDKKQTWKTVIVPRYEANSRDTRLANKRKPHPAAKLIMRLHRNDYLLLTDNETKKQQLFRIQRLSSGEIICCPPETANADAQNRDKENSFKFTNISARKLKNDSAVKIHISPTGRISPKPNAIANS